MSVTRWQEPNLARNPFVNERPVRRLAIVLWVLFVLVGGAGFWMSRTIRLETGTRVAELERLNAATVSDRDRAVRLEADLRSADLPAQNERAEFLNRRLAERSFSWNRLLETLTIVLPRGVRLVQLSPEGFTRERGRAQADATTAATSRVALRISGEAEETEALLEFVDRLFAHPAFDRANLSRESTKKDFKIQFEITVDYLPQVAGQGAAGKVAAEGSAVDASGAPLPEVEATGTLVGAARSPAGAAKSGAIPALAPGAPLAPVTGRELPASRATAGAGLALREGRGLPSGNEETTPETGGRSYGAASAGASRTTGIPGSTAPVLGAGRGSPAAPAPGAAGAGGRSFPGNVMPTPIKPYASSTGGGG